MITTVSSIDPSIITHPTSQQSSDTTTTNRIEMDIPLVSVQPSTMEVIKDLSNNKIKRESVWVNIDKIDATVDAFKSDDKVQFTTDDKITVELKSKHCIQLDHDSKKFSALFPTRTFPLYNKTQNITSLDVSPGGELVVVGDESGGLDIITHNDGAVRRQLEGHYVITSKTKFFASGQVVLSAGDMHQIKIWSAVDGSNPRTLTGHTQTVTDIAMIGRGRNVISSSNDGTVKLWECGSGSCIHSFNFGRPVVALAVVNQGSAGDMDPLEYETEGRTMIVTTEDTVESIDLRTKQQTKVNIDADAIADSHITAVAAEGSKAVIATASGRIVVFDWKTGNTLHEYNKHSQVNALDIQQNLLAIAAQDSTPVVIDLRSNLITYLSGYESASSSIHILNNRVYVGGKSGSVRCYELEF